MTEAFEQQPPHEQISARKIDTQAASGKPTLAESVLAPLRNLVSAGNEAPTVVFSGTDAEQKLAAAATLAREAGVDLYQVSLAAVVSKYIGETEKNLDHIFKSAPEQGAILFFDEADALFGKRSDVKDSHDRFANIEISYLLLARKTFHGTVILSTESQATDSEGKPLHLDYEVHFPLPGEK